MSHTANLRWLGRAGVLVPLLLLLASQHAVGQGRLYWTEPDNPAIMSSNFDGSAQVKVAQGFALEGPLDMDIDQVTGWVYWADQGTYRISGMSPDGREGGAIIPHPDAPYGVAVDGMNGYLYWTEKSAIKRSRLDGTDPVSLVTSFEWPQPLEISVDDGLMFWSDYSGGTYRSKLDGTEILKISTAGRYYLAVDDVHKEVFIASGMHILKTSFDGAVADTVVKSSSYIYAVAVEPAANRLCWIQHPGPDAEPAELMCASSDGSNSVKLLDISGGVPDGLAINRTSRMIYFTTGQWHAELIRCQYDGSGVEHLTSSMAEPVDVAVDPIEDKVYWVDGLHPRYWLSRSDLDGRNFEDIDIELPGPLPPLDGLDVLSAIALDPTNRSVYVGTEGSIGVPTTLIPGRVIMGPLDGPVNNVIESGSYETIFDIETDVAHGKVYYVGHLGELWQRNLDGSDPVLLETSVGSGIAVSSRYLYWLDLASKTIKRADLDGTNPTDLLTGVSVVRDMVVDAGDNYLWWSIGGSKSITRLQIGQTEAHEIVTGNAGIGGLFVVSAPSSVTQIAPLSGAADLPTTVMLQWSRPPDAQRFDVQVASGTNISNVVFSSNTPNTEEAFVAPFAEASYYWRVRAIGAGGIGPFTEYVKFAVGGSGPLAATLLAPSSGESGVAVPTTFQWVNAPEAVYHRIQVAPTASFVNPVLDVDSLTEASYEGLSLDHDKTYYWRIAGFSDDGKSTFTASWHFRTVISAPEAVTLSSPAGDATGVPAYAVFTWEDVPGADSYRVEVASDAEFADVVVDVEAMESVYTLSEPLAYDTQYYWRVRASNAGGDGAWSETRGFHTVVGTATEDEAVPTAFALYQNYPNPFAHSTQIRYDVPTPEHVRIIVFDALGRQVERLVDGMQPAGTHTVTFLGDEQPAGLYVCRMRAGTFERILTMVVAG